MGLQLPHMVFVPSRLKVRNLKLDRIVTKKWSQTCVSLVADHSGEPPRTQGVVGLIPASGTEIYAFFVLSGPSLS